MSIPSRIPALVVLLAAAGCAADAPIVDYEAEAAALHALDEEWSRAAAENRDVEIQCRAGAGKKMLRSVGRRRPG